MHYDVKLRITYDVGGSAASGRTVLRVLPLDVPGLQRVLHSEVQSDPKPDEQQLREDFFGNRTVEIDHRDAWSELSIVMQARVERLHRQRSLDFSPALTDLRSELANVRSLRGDSPQHFIAPSGRTMPAARIDEFAHRAAHDARNVFDAALAINRAVNGAMKFDAKATDVNTPAADAFAKKRGVCQDFTHIMIIALKALGIPAGYVSGYLRTIPPPGKQRMEGADAMHAWVRAWCGNDLGWVEFDPTNNLVVGTDHIVAGYGRDYADVSPVRGVLRTAGEQDTDQAVDVIPLD